MIGSDTPYWIEADMRRALERRCRLASEEGLSMVGPGTLADTLTGSRFRLPQRMIGSMDPPQRERLLRGVAMGYRRKELEGQPGRAG